MSPHKTDVSVGFIILSWNGAALLQACLESLKKQTYKQITVCLVDNGSTDDTQAVFEAATLPQKLLISNQENRGFAPAVNQGVQRLLEEKTDYIVLLNNDVTLSPEWTATMVAAMNRANERVGFAQGANYTNETKEHYDSTGIYLEEGFIPRQKTNTALEPKPVGPNGAALMMRRAFVEDMSYRGELLDGKFFAYVEDVDLLVRAYLKGWQFGFFPQAEAIHVGSATGERVSTKKMYWGARNMVWLLVKDVPFGVGLKKAKKITISHLADMEFLLRTNRRLFWSYLRGTTVGLLTIPLFLTKRRHIMKTRSKTNTEILQILTPSSPPLTNPVKYIVRKLTV